MNKNIKRKLLNNPEVEVQKWWILMNQKYKKSIQLYTFLNIITFLLTAILILVNLWAMLEAKDESGSGWEWKCLLSIAIITAITGLISTILSIFKFKVRSRNAKEAITEIKQEYNEYKNKKGKYQDKELNDQIFLEKISNMSFIEI